MTADESTDLLRALELAEWQRAHIPSLPNAPEAYQLTDGKHVLAWIEQRNRYCDRGHWQAIVECVPNLDAYDGFPRYYMRLEVAKQEVIDFLRWRLAKVRAEDTPPTMLDAMLEERAEAIICSADELAAARRPCNRQVRDYSWSVHGIPYTATEHAFEFDEARNVHVCPCGAAVPDREP